MLLFYAKPNFWISCVCPLVDRHRKLPRVVGYRHYTNPTALGEKWPTGIRNGRPRSRLLLYKETDSPTLIKMAKSKEIELERKTNSNVISLSFPIVRLHGGRGLGTFRGNWLIRASSRWIVDLTNKFQTTLLSKWDEFKESSEKIQLISFIEKNKENKNKRHEKITKWLEWGHCRRWRGRCKVNKSVVWWTGWRCESSNLVVVKKGSLKNKNKWWQEF